MVNNFLSSLPYHILSWTDHAKILCAIITVHNCLEVMAVNEYLYNKEFICPICNNQFKSSVVRLSMLRLEKKDSDLCKYFKNENPYFYEIKICPNCGFSFSDHSKTNLNDEIKRNFYQMVTKQWDSRDYCGQRSIQEAIITFKLALLTAEIINESLAVKGNYCLKLCWLNRIAGNKDEELRFMRSAVSAFEKSYSTEDIKEAGIVQPDVLIYILGELNFRLKNYKDARKWFGIAIGLCSRNPLMDNKSKNLIRDRWMDIKQEVTQASANL